MIREAMILAGGLGTRLRDAVPDLPKALAPVASKPFIFHLINYFLKQGIDHFIFCLGYKNEVIAEYLLNSFPDLKMDFSVEKDLLGTGGAIRKAAGLCWDEDVLILNGDTYYEADLKKLFDFHHQNQSDCTLCLKPVYNTDRYGVVEINKDGHVQKFSEREFNRVGLINAGVYALNIDHFSKHELPSYFSFEKDYLKSYIGIDKLMGLVQDEYFIDIGIPEDLSRANSELGK